MRSLQDVVLFRIVFKKLTKTAIFSALTFKVAVSAINISLVFVMAMDSMVTISVVWSSKNFHISLKNNLLKNKIQKIRNQINLILKIIKEFLKRVFMNVINQFFQIPKNLTLNLVDQLWALFYSTEHVFIVQT